MNPYEPHLRADGRRRHPGASAWFTRSALPTIDRIGGYLDILDVHGVEWKRLDTDTPGVIPQQVVAVPNGATAPVRC
ncbi:hypothetical protein [Nocardia sp. MW-W600-9]